MLSYPPYSPDLDPFDYLLFPKLKVALKDSYFDDVPTIMKAATRILEQHYRNPVMHL